MSSEHTVRRLAKLLSGLTLALLLLLQTAVPALADAGADSVSLCVAAVVYRSGSQKKDRKR